MKTDFCYIWLCNALKHVALPIGLPFRGTEYICLNLNAEAPVTTESQEPFPGMLVEDAGSSRDLRNLCPLAAEAAADERFPESSWTPPPCSDLALKQTMAAFTQTTPRVIARHEMKSVTVKATYREDIIRFRISLSCGIVELKEEVAKRMKLEVATFDIKYLDDDNEWVLIASDADLQECLDV